jgi:hypothetical protein
MAPLYEWMTAQAGLSRAGAIPVVTGLSVKEYASAGVHRTELTFVDVAFALTDNPAVVAYSGKKIYDFPAGLIAILGAVANLALTKSAAGVNADWDGDFALGTVTATNAALLATTEQNIIPTTATPQAVAGATTAKGIGTATELFKLLDGTATAIDLFANLKVDDADHDVTTTPTNLIVNGTVVIHWMNVGDV